MACRGEKQNMLRGAEALGALTSVSWWYMEKGTAKRQQQLITHSGVLCGGSPKEYHTFGCQTVKNW